MYRTQSIMLTMGLQKHFTQAAQERPRSQKVKGPNCTVVIVECVNWPFAKPKRQKLHAEDQEMFTCAGFSCLLSSCAVGLWPVTSWRALCNKESVKLQDNPVKKKRGGLLKPPQITVGLWRVWKQSVVYLLVRLFTSNNLQWVKDKFHS